MGGLEASPKEIGKDQNAKVRYRETYTSHETLEGACTHSKPLSFEAVQQNTADSIDKTN